MNLQPISLPTTVVKCPKHGEHPHVIKSDIKGREGVWCQLCWLEMLGPSLPHEFKRIPLEDV